MNKILFLSIMSFIIISCNPQIDLEVLEYNTKIQIPAEELEIDQSINVPLEGIYRVKNLNKFKFNNISLNNDVIEFYNELLVNENKLYLIVDSYNSNNYLGFELHLINENTSDKFLDLLLKKYNKPIKQFDYIEDNYKDVQYLWQSNNTNEIILFDKHNENNHLDLTTKNKTVLSETRIIVLRDNLKAVIDSQDSRNDPEKIKSLLLENPDAFSILEVFKSQIRSN